MRELERLHAQIRNAELVAVDIDMWEHGGKASATPEQCAAREAELAEAMQQKETARAALEALVARMRVEAPSELAGWALAHHAYLSMFIDDCAARGELDSAAAATAMRQRAHWMEFRAGTRAVVDVDVQHLPIDEARYRTHFGIDPTTLERVG
jgi:hypothetical protein